MKMAKDEWLTVRQTAELSGYSDQYIRRQIRKGKIVARKFGPVWQVSKSSFLEYLKEAKRSKDKRRGPKTGS
jgi:excisionase family DNA binding protein